MRSPVTRVRQGYDNTLCSLSLSRDHHPLVPQNQRRLPHVTPFADHTPLDMDNLILKDALLDAIEDLYIDDVLIHGGDPTTFLANVRKVFSRLREFKVDVNPKKTKLGLEEGEYIGHANTESTVIIHRTRQLLPRSCATHDGDVQSTPCYELQSASKPLSTVNKPSPTTRNSTSSKTP